MTGTQVKKAKRLVDEEMRRIIESRFYVVNDIRKKILAGLGITREEYSLGEILPLIEDIINKKYKELIPLLDDIKESFKREIVKFNDNFIVDYKKITNTPKEYDDSLVLERINILKKAIKEIKQEKKITSHDELKGVSPNDHHNEKHDLESHINSELLDKIYRLVGGGEVDDLHKHKQPKLKETRMNTGLWNPMHFHDDVYYKKDEVVALIAAVSAPTIYTETPTGLIDGVNDTYTTTTTITNVYSFAINGQFIHPAEYTVAGNTITMTAPLDASLSGLGFTIIYS